MIDVFPALLAELRDDAAVTSITTRVRAHEPAPGDALGAGNYVPFAVLVDLGGPPHTRVPIQMPSYLVRCYGVTPQGAKALYVACSNAIHAIGPRLHSGVGIYVSHDATGGDEGSDPRTSQPYVEFTVALVATTALVA